MSAEKDKMEEIVTKFGDKMLQWTENAEGFASDQIPLLIDEILTFHMYEAIFYCSIGLILSILCLLLWKHLYHNPKLIEPKNKNDLPFFCVLLVPSIPAFLISVPIVLVNIHTMIMIYVAPRLYLIEYLKEFAE